MPGIGAAAVVIVVRRQRQFFVFSLSAAFFIFIIIVKIPLIFRRTVIIPVVIIVSGSGIILFIIGAAIPLLIVRFVIICRTAAAFVIRRPVVIFFVVITGGVFITLPLVIFVIVFRQIFIRGKSLFAGRNIVIILRGLLLFGANVSAGGILGIGAAQVFVFLFVINGKRSVFPCFQTGSAGLVPYRFQSGYFFFVGSHLHPCNHLSCRLFIIA